MQASEVPLAVAAALSTASAFDLTVDDAIVLQDANRLVLRLMPCDVVAVAFGHRREDEDVGFRHLVGLSENVIGRPAVE